MTFLGSAEVYSKPFRPLVYIEEPRHLPTSIVISRCTTKQKKQHKTEENKAKQINKLHTEEKKKAEKFNKLHSEEEKRILKQRKSDEKKIKNEQQPTATKKDLPSLKRWYRLRKALNRIKHDRRKERQDKVSALVVFSTLKKKCSLARLVQA